MSKALIVVDMQYDLCEGGPMAHENSLQIIPIINSLRDEYELVIFTNILHPKNHSSFKEFGGIYPKNCIIDTHGSLIHDDIIVHDKDIIITRGRLQKYDSKSIFYEADEIERETNLKNILSSKQIKDLYFCGNGIESIIFSSIMDALGYRFKCYVIHNAIGFIDKDKANKCIDFLKHNNVLFI